MTVSRFKMRDGSTLNLTPEDASKRRNEILADLGPRQIPTAEEYVDATQRDMPEILGAATNSISQRQLVQKEHELAEKDEEIETLKRQLAGQNNPETPADVEIKRQDIEEVKNKARTTKQ